MEGLTVSELHRPALAKFRLNAGFKLCVTGVQQSLDAKPGSAVSAPREVSQQGDAAQFRFADIK